MKVAITGSIACGKSTVSDYLISKGYRVIDADKIGHDVLNYDSVKKELVEHFSSEILENNEVNRKELSKIVFSSKKNLFKLNSITHPVIKKKILENLDTEERLIFLDIALLFESKFVDLVDKVIVVHVNKETQIYRLVKRNNFSIEEAEKRIASQIPSEEKIILADYVLDNNGTREQLYNQIDNILNKVEEEIDGFRNKKLDGRI
ncbi:dephospho-CoA kinase [Gemella sp. GH3]|nr:dephospho-CoA kinase [Gemella sp. GH3.1]NYS50417.1 dephospho-CoA kinase [Gemella sp. GH3]